MKKILIVLCFVIALMLGTSIAVSAEDCNNCSNPCAGIAVSTEGCNDCFNPCAKELGAYCVTYHANNCLMTVPIDQNLYHYGDTVTVLFDPVLYKDGLIFYGWSHTPNGYANYGYAYNQFRMPAQNIDLYAICIAPYYGPQPSQSRGYDCCWGGSWGNVR